MENEIPQKKIFLIDMENVGCNSLTGYELLAPRDEIHLFIGRCTDKIKTDFLANMQKKQIKVVYHDIIVNGKNALDFQITSFLGVLVSTKKNADFYIVTEDKGYDSSILFLKDHFNKRKIHIQRISCFLELDENYEKMLLAKPKELTQKEKREQEAKQLIKNIIRIPASYNGDTYKDEVLLNIFFNGCKKKTSREMKKHVHEKAICSFGNTIGEDIFLTNKNILSSLYKNVNNFLEEEKTN